MGDLMITLTGVWGLILWLQLCTVMAHVTKKVLWNYGQCFGVGALWGISGLSWAWLLVVTALVVIPWHTMYVDGLRKKLIPIKRWPENWDWWHLFSFLSHWPVCIVSWSLAAFRYTGMDIISWRGLHVLLLSCILGIGSKLIWMKFRNPEWPTLTEQWRDTDG